jgi:hypothetical protein
MLFGLLGLLVLLVPFLDRGAEEGRRGTLFSALGLALLVYVTGFTAYGYRSWVPVLITIAVGGLLFLHGVRSGGRNGK